MLAIYVPSMRNSILEIRTAGFSGCPQLNHLFLYTITRNALLKLIFFLFENCRELRYLTCVKDGGTTASLLFLNKKIHTKKLNEREGICTGTIPSCMLRRFVKM